MKIFTQNEILLIEKSDNKEITIWSLWTKKEAVYKLYVQETGVVGYFPLKIVCLSDQDNSKVTIGSIIYETFTTINSKYIYTIALKNKYDFDLVFEIKTRNNIIKNNNIPKYINPKTNKIFSCSISNHGRFERIIVLNS